MLVPSSLSSQHTPLSREKPNNLTMEAKCTKSKLEYNRQATSGWNILYGAHVLNMSGPTSGPKPNSELDGCVHLGSTFTCSPDHSCLLRPGPHLELLGPTTYLPHLGAEQRPQ